MIYNISDKTLIHLKPFLVGFDNIDGFIRNCDGARYLTSFGYEKYVAIYNRISYLISLKSGMAYISPHYFAKIKVDCYYSLPIKK